MQDNVIAYLWYQNDEDTFLESLVPNGVKILATATLTFLAHRPIKKFLAKTVMSSDSIVKSAKRDVESARETVKIAQQKKGQESKKLQQSSSTVEL
jgi:hypothetical protein